MAKNDIKIKKSLRLLAVSSFIVFIGVAFSKLFTYIYRIIIARSFEPATYGLFSLASMILLLFIVISSLGLNEGLVRYIPFYRGKKEIGKINSLVRISSIVSLFSSITAGVTLYVLSGFISLNIFHDVALQPFLQAFSFAIPFYALANIYLATLRASEKIGWYSFIVNFLQTGVRILILIILIAIGLQNSSIIVSYLLSIIIMMIFAYVAARKYLPRIIVPQKTAR